MQSLYGQLAGDGQVFLELAEVGREQYPDLSGVKGLVRRFERVLPICVEFRDENGLIHLHPVNAMRCKRVKQPGVLGQQPGK